MLLLDATAFALLLVASAHGSMTSSTHGEIADLQLTTRNQAQELVEHEQKNRKFQEDIERLTAEIKALRTEVSLCSMKVDESVAKVKKEMSAQSAGSVAFAAEQTQTVSGQNTIIPYGRMITNEGTGYDNNTFTFTSAVKAIYFFSWTNLLEASSSSYPCSYLAVDGIQVNGFANWNVGTISQESTATQTAVIVLNRGQQANVRVGQWPTCKSFYTSAAWGRVNSFKGFMIRNLEV